MKKPKSLKTKIIVTAVLVVLAGLSAGVLFLTRRTPEAVTKLYTQGVFKYISLPVKWLENLIPYSAGELALLTLCIVLPVALIVSVVRCFTRGSARPLAKYGLNVLTLAALAVILYVWFGGLNYNALTFAERHGYELKESTAAELMDLCTELSERAAAERNKLPQDANGTVISDATVFELCEQAQAGYDAIAGRFPEFQGFYPRPKPALTSTLMCYFQISGIYPYISPEAIVNARTPVYELPHTICHEMAHQRGVAREDEANYVGYLAAVNNPDPLFRYSGYLEALSYSLSALGRASGEAYRRVLPLINRGVLRDIAAADKFWKSFEEKNELPAKISSAVNNTYLQVQNIPDGTRSYGRMVDLLLAEFREAH
ncbi:MAG: DUF3810 domain-containing protein [Clostridia bacterium]|nr:DUF3810 domain-containing protein [Clostridia bacterium]